MIDQHTAHLALRYTHIVAGGLGLVCFWIPVFARKGGRLHIATGRTFVWLARIVAASAVVSIAWALTSPISFASITRTLSAAEFQTLSTNIRFFMGLLGLLTAWFVAGLQLGVRAVKTRQRQDELGDATTLTICYASVLASIAAICFGGYGLLSNGQQRYVILVVLGIFGVFDGKKMLQTLGKTNHGKMDWWYLHMENMFGAGIAFHTAFFVFGARRLIGDLSGPWAIVPWVIPAAIGIPATHYWIAHYRRKFERTPVDAATPGEPVGAA